MSAITSFRESVDRVAQSQIDEQIQFAALLIGSGAAGIRHVGVDDDIDEFAGHFLQLGGLLLLRCCSIGCQMQLKP
jgi:hypothetical protein